jgi:hypothetical protein
MGKNKNNGKSDGRYDQTPKKLRNLRQVNVKSMLTKNWQKIDANKYSFSVNDTEMGTMEVILNSIDTKAVAKIGADEIIIRRTGFWKNVIELTTQNNEVIAKVYAEKWYANTLILDYKDKNYKIIIRNNPLAEWAITENNKDLLAYGLNTDNGNGMVTIKISSAENNQDYILDFLLWYLFVPIAIENMGDSFSFLMLLAVQ